MDTIDSECAEARKAAGEALAAGVDRGLLLLGLHGDLLEPESAFANPTVLSAVLHVAGCSACKTWLDVLDPLRAAQRANQAKYCCQSLYLAATVDDEEDRQFLSVRYTTDLDRYPMWLAEGKAPPFRYCPWCSTLLPADGYEGVAPAT